LPGLSLNHTEQRVEKRNIKSTVTSLLSVYGLQDLCAFFMGKPGLGIFPCDQEKENKVRETERQEVLKAASWLLLLGKPIL
jgi:hypothetical protein